MNPILYQKTIAYYSNLKTNCFIFSKFIYVNYNATFGFTKKESSYIAGSVYFVSMILAPMLGFAVVSEIDTNINSSV